MAPQALVAYLATIWCHLPFASRILCHHLIFHSLFANVGHQVGSHALPHCQPESHQLSLNKLRTHSVTDIRTPGIPGSDKKQWQSVIRWTLSFVVCSFVCLFVGWLAWKIMVKKRWQRVTRLIYFTSQGSLWDRFLRLFRPQGAQNDRKATQKGTIGPHFRWFWK